MKQKSLFIFLAVFSICSSIFAQELEESVTITTEFSIEKSSFEKKQILSLLFDGDYNSEWERISWKPYPNERIQTSLNNKCYTNIDSLLYYHLDSSNYALVVLRTVKMNYIDDSTEVEMSSMADPSTVGLAQFVMKENKWVLQSFERSIITIGQAGYIPPYHILNLNRETKVFSLKDDEHQELDVFEYLYSLDSLNFSDELFSYCHYEVINMTDEGNTYRLTNMIVHSEKITENPDDFSYYPITLSTRHVIYTEKEDIVLQSYDTKYVFFNNKYQVKIE
jgi:hypothetical protein